MIFTTSIKNDLGNILIGIMFLVVGVSGFAALKINEKKKDKKKDKK